MFCAKSCFSGETLLKAWNSGLQFVQNWIQEFPIYSVRPFCYVGVAADNRYPSWQRGLGAVRFGYHHDF
jgi:hypothetical protein